MKHLQDILTESLLDIDNDAGLDDRMVVSQFFVNVESQQKVVDHIQGLIEASGEPSITFTAVKNDLWSDNMYVVFPKKQTPNGYRIIIIKRGKHGFRMWSAYADTILDQTLVSAGEAKYICGAKSNIIYKVPSSMYKLFDTIVHKKINDKLGIKESLLDDEDVIAKGVERKYSVPNLIKNLGNIRDPEKYKSVGDMIINILNPYLVKKNMRRDLETGKVYFIRAKRFNWDDGLGGRVGITGTKPYNTAILIVGESEAKLRVSRCRDMFPFANGFIFDINVGNEYKNFKESLQTTKDIDVYEIPQEYRDEIVRIVTFHEWKKYDSI